MKIPVVTPWYYGDYSLGLWRYVAISLLAHSLFFLTPDFSPQGSAAAPSRKIQVSLPGVVTVAAASAPAKANFVAPGVASAAQMPASPQRPKIAQISRSTAKIQSISPRNTPQHLNPEQAESQWPEESEIALYRLALARNASRLLPAEWRTRSPAEGMLALELQLQLSVGQHKQPGALSANLRLQSGVLSKDWGDEVLQLLQLAVRQTDVPADWAGRSIKIPLRLQWSPGSEQTASIAG